MRIELVSVLLVSTLLGACRGTGGAASSSKPNDLPSFLQPERVLAYKGKSVAELDALFVAADSPAALPSGNAIGIHIIPADTQAQVPVSLTVVTKTLWKGKTFDGNAGIMLDRVLGPDLGVGAQLYIEPLATNLARYGWDGLDANAVIDRKPSLITDYHGYHMAETPSLLTKDTKGWIDECRIVEIAPPSVWLCRSTYLGVFWGHVVLQMTE